MDVFAHAGDRHLPLASFIRQPLAPQPSVRRNTQSNSQAQYNDEEMQVVETLQNMYEQAGFGITRRERNASRSATVGTSILYQAEPVNSVNDDDGFIAIEVGYF